MKKLYIVLSIVFVIAGFSVMNYKGRPLDQKLVFDQSDKIKLDKYTEAMRMLNDHDKKAVLAYSMRVVLASALAGRETPDITIREALKAQGDFVARQINKKEVIEVKKQEIKRDPIHDQVTIKVLSKKYVDSDYRKKIYEDSNSLTIRISNHGANDVKAIKFNIEVLNLFGDKVKSLRLIANKLSGKRYTDRVYDFNYNQFKAEDKDLRSYSMDELKFKYIITDVVYD